MYFKSSKHWYPNKSKQYSMYRFCCKYFYIELNTKYKDLFVLIRYESKWTRSITINLFLNKKPRLIIMRHYEHKLS